jgi:hypothetical protein
MPSVAFPLASRSALGLNLNPFYPGVDATVHLFGGNWLTTTFQFPAYNVEWIWNGSCSIPCSGLRAAAVSAGLFYRKERISYYVDDGAREFPPVRVHTQNLSQRLVRRPPGRTISRYDGRANRRMKFHVHAGYNPDYQSALFMFGIGVTFRPNPGPSFRDPVRYWD